MKQDARLQLDTRVDTIAGWRMFTRLCESSGADRPPIVMVHGLAMSSRYMVPIARELAADFHVYALDFPGFGESQKSPGALSMPQLAKLLRAWMDTMGVGRPVLLGNSLGCEIIANFVLQNPGRAVAAVMIGPTMDPRIRSLSSSLAHGAWNMLFEPVSFYPTLVRDYFIYGARRTLKSIEEAFRDPIERKLERLDLPILVVRGQHDKLCSQPWAERVTALLPRGRLAVVPGAAHVVNFDSPRQLGELVREFLAETQET